MSEPVPGVLPLPLEGVGSERQPKENKPARVRVKRKTSLIARGDPFVWMTGGGLALAVLMIVSLLALVVYNGTRTFWPRPLVEIGLIDGRSLLGEVTRTELYRVGPELEESLPDEMRAAIAAEDGYATRRLLRVGNFDISGEDFVWVSDFEIVSESRPRDAWLIERREWGVAIGRVAALHRDGERIAEGSEAVEATFPSLHREAGRRYREIRKIEKHEIGAINHRLERARLAVRKAEIDFGEGSERHTAAAAAAVELEETITAEYEALQQRIVELREENARVRLEVHEIGGELIAESRGSDTPMRISQVVRAYPANAVSTLDRIGIYLDRWREFIVSEPREANTEGGVWPAIFGTFMMTVLMSLAVAPFGVITALYLREYAKQGPVVSAVRIAVNNLAGVPSIVYGVFGLGFFCYVLGGSIDSLLFPERLPSPTFGTGGILWASLTLALLTVPVVIVATEEALAAVPRSMREGSIACGASRWQTIWRIVIPRATPGIMTGMILAMARGAGEVAPLMITGVVKLAPELPFDSYFPYIHLERSFMHLGFHIFDVGFQSRNSEAGKPMVFTTTLLLIGLIAMLNLFAISLRSRLKRRFRAAEF